MDSTCRNPECGDPAATMPRRKGYCIPCASYRLKYRKDRPLHVIERAWERSLLSAQRRANAVQ